MMDKVIVIGSPGAGKSEFSRKLEKVTHLPLYYLDQIWHKSDQTTVSNETFDFTLNQILTLNQWIIDGTYLRTMERRLLACDTVFLLDYPVDVCLEGARSRIGKKRVDMPWIEKELDSEFEEWILNFSKDQLPQIYHLLEKNSQKNIVVFHSRDEANIYLKKLID